MTPAPGSPEAVAAGCECPTGANCHGLGYLGGIKDPEGNTIYVYSADCPIHAKQLFGESPEVGK